MRKSIDGLSAIVGQNFHLDPFEKSLFLFCGRRRDRIKGLLWEGDRFLLLYKRFEGGSFNWPKDPQDVLEITPQQDQVYKLEESQRTCPKCGDNLSVVSKKFLRSEIKYIPAEISIVNIYLETYECRKCKKEGLPSFFNPYTPEPVLQHSYVTASSVVWTMYQKFVQAVPLYR